MAKRSRLKLFVLSTLTYASLFEAVGCPQLFSRSIIDGTRGFVESGLATAIVSALDLEGSTDLTDETP